jgi:hypothetical protein
VIALWRRYMKVRPSRVAQPGGNIGKMPTALVATPVHCLSSSQKGALPTELSMIARSLTGSSWM